MIIQRLMEDKLKNYLEMIWYVNKDLDADDPKEDIIMPTDHFHIAYNFSSPYFLKLDTQMDRIPDALFMGPFKTPMRVEYGESIQQIGLAFTPLGFYTFFEKMPNFFNDLAIDISNIEMFKPLNDLTQSLFKNLKRDHDKVSSVMDQLKNYFLEELTYKEVSHEVGDMMMYIDAQECQIDISEMAAYFSYSVSGLERRFKKYFFMSPKAYGNIIKFRFAMADETPQNYFYDQAHFIKNVKKYTTLNPGKLSETDAMTLLQMLE